MRFRTTEVTQDGIRGCRCTLINQILRIEGHFGRLLYR